MPLLFRGLRRLSRADRRPTVRSRSFQPNFEALDSRIVPTVSYHGGPVLAHVEVHNVFYGQNWAAGGPSAMNALNKFQSDIVQSPYLAMLGEYGVGRGTEGKSDLVAGSSSPANNSQVSEATIQTMLAGQINGGLLPEENGKQLYFVYLAPNVKSGWDQANNALAHHGSFQMLARHQLPYVGGFITYYTTDTVYYAVVTNPAGNSGFNNSLTTFQNQTEVSSHELAEAVTDPDIRQAGNNTDWNNSHLAWIDMDPYVYRKYGSAVLRFPNPNYKAEIGDLVNGQFANFLALSTTYTVQQEYSVLLGQGILANGSQSWLMDLPGTNRFAFTYTWSYAANDPGGNSLTLHRAIGTDGRWYMNWEIAPGDYSGWFTTG